MILVTGATGQLGAAVVRQLLARTDASEIAVLVRDPGKAAALERQGVQVRVGEYGDPGSLARAMKGADRILLVASSEFAQLAQQHQNVIDAAKAAGVALLGFTSRSLTDIEGSRNTMLRDYFQTEASIRESGVPAVIFRNALYLDTLPLFLGGPAVFHAGIRLPTGQGAVAFALRREMGRSGRQRDARPPRRQPHLRPRRPPRLHLRRRRPGTEPDLRLGRHLQPGQR